MNWNTLLSYKRLGQQTQERYDSARPPWQVDYDRIVFSSAFRRMQDKTQVFPLSGSDFVRTRLTHSLEVSTVARTIGTMAGKIILDRHGDEVYTPDGATLKETLAPSDIGTITATGGLAHDIGNPPFGHSGEDSIRYWFRNSQIADQIRAHLTEAQIAEFENWEGNAEGFRILARQQMVRNGGGLRLTAASLGAYAKYPTAATAVSAEKGETGHQAAKKPGFFENDRELWQEVAGNLGLIKHSNKERWSRHPLAYLTEAADDICYRIIDLEDGYRLGRISYSELENILLAAAGGQAEVKLSERPDRDEMDKATYLRAIVFGVVIKQIVEVFADNETSMLDGLFQGDILKTVHSHAALEAMKAMAVAKVYSTRSVLEVEAAGFEIIPGLLDAFASATNTVASENIRRTTKSSGGETPACAKSRKILSLMPSEFLGANRMPEEDSYVRLLGVVDFVAGMTDSFALTLYRRIKGVSLPN